MTRDEFSDLAALWGDEPGGARREIEALARRTPRQARLVLWGELAVVAVLAATILLAMIWRLGTATLLLGSLVLVLLGWSAWKRHHLGAIALLVADGDRMSFVARAAQAKQAELNRSAIGLALILPGTLLAMLLGFSLRQDGDGGDVAAFIAAILTTPRGLVAAGFMTCAIMVLAFSHLRLTGEYRRLRALEADYEAEAKRDRAGR